MIKLPKYSFLIPASLLLGLAPFVPEPHLVEKIRWLFTGHPFKPIDVFDLFLHGTFPALLLVKAGQDLVGRVAGGEETVGPKEGEEDPTPAPKTRAQRRQEERAEKDG